MVIYDYGMQDYEYTPPRQILTNSSLNTVEQLRFQPQVAREHAIGTLRKGDIWKQASGVFPRRLSSRSGRVLDLHLEHNFA